MGLKDRSTEIKHGLPGHLLGPVPLQTGLESKVSPSHQALLQHLLQKEQMRQQKMLSSGKTCSLMLSITLYYLALHYIWYTLNESHLHYEFNSNTSFDFFFSRPRLHVIPPSVPSGHEGSPLQQSA